MTRPPSSRARIARSANDPPDVPRGGHFLPSRAALDEATVRPPPISIMSRSFPSAGHGMAHFVKQHWKPRRYTGEHSASGKSGGLRESSPSSPLMRRPPHIRRHVKTTQRVAAARRPHPRLVPLVPRHGCRPQLGSQDPPPSRGGSCLFHASFNAAARGDVGGRAGPWLGATRGRCGVRLVT